jgi:HPt (histidine-containing phosphotransfer) domain-containing protein
LKLGDDDTILDLPPNQRLRANLKSKQRWAQLICEYLQDLPGQLDAVRATFEKRDYTGIKKQAHRIKGTSGTYRLDTISQDAAQLERSADARNPGNIAAALNDITRSVEMESSRLNPQAAGFSEGAERTADG